MNEEFDEIFSSHLDGEPATDEKEPEPQVEAEAPAEPEPETEAEEAKGEEGEPPAPEVESIPKTALLDERKKRQARDERIAELEAQLKEKEQKPDILEDPEAYTEHLEQKVENMVLQRTFDASEKRARKAHGDEAVEQAFEVFEEMLQADPTLKAKALHDSDPFEFIIEKATAHQKIEQAGGIDKLIAEEVQKATSKIRAELEAEYQGKSKAKEDIRSSIPKTLTGEASKGERDGPGWSPPDLDDLVTNIEER